jgi:hypothetical protein
MVKFQTICKSQFGFILEGLEMKNVGVCMAVSNTYGNLVNFVVILVHISRFGILHQEKSGTIARVSTEAEGSF